MFNNKSYQKHIDHELKCQHNEIAFNNTFSFDTVDYWRHERMLSFINPIISTYPKSSWLTIGDGRFGSDANYLKRKGIDNVHASSISTHTLIHSHEKGYINKYSAQNVESLTFDDNSFDFILCKEAFHHFPRPYLGLYEMTRVAKKGVILIEPYDPYVYDKLITHLSRTFKDKIKTIMGKEIDRNCFEESGNYKYMLSEREIEKYAIAAEAKTIIFHKLNDTFIDGGQTEKVSDNSKLFKKIKKSIRYKNVLCTLGLSSYAIICSLINLSTDKMELEKIYKKNKINIKKYTLPQNPY
ncbi:hypothetical protein DID76_00755 [Candidatus Marinamargulisbacteria bacterium SCGC AG-414-C22]|nr:hypothetical protein DID76_00755 [Candidatus Marinamargulisbacteria bacterium SCGC AG-414-C22]